MDDTVSSDGLPTEARSGGSCRSACGRRLFLSGTSLPGLNGASDTVVCSLIV